MCVQSEFKKSGAWNFLPLASIFHPLKTCMSLFTSGHKFDITTIIYSATQQSSRFFLTLNAHLFLPIMNKKNITFSSSISVQSVKDRSVTSYDKL